MGTKPRKDATRVLRLNMIVDYISKRTLYGGVTVKELAQKYEVSERQIHRDLKTIQNDLMVSLIKNERSLNGRKSTYYCLEVGYLPGISPEKATVLILSLLQKKGSALAGHLNDLKDVLVSTLFKYHCNPVELAVEKLQSRIYLVEENLAEPEWVGNIFTGLVGALKDGYRIKIRYFAACSRQITEQVVEPYGLICKRQNWYLVAFCLKRQDIRVFKVDQVIDAIPYTAEKFHYPEDFNLKEYMAQSWGVISDGEVCRVKIKFGPNVAFRVQNIIYHPSQVIEEEMDDGSIIVSFNVCGIAEMKTWMAQWGDAVEVLEPGWLREDMCKMAENIIRVYRNNKQL
ncbi:WYL domain-containing protein [Desulfoscipio sp. XC116]|uniref:helix-turn-helix transcriptional regulator n=1 Tax=Desulfoscipio sp. XC116 TaxID=3144975 RepID=UPI00325C2A6B